MAEDFVSQFASIESTVDAGGNPGAALGDAVALAPQVLAALQAFEHDAATITELQ